ncbi:MAG: Gfo/Idh/MocA family protein [Thermoprotei archaeon]
MVLRAGIIGCGGVANTHATNLSKNPEVKLVAFCDVIEKAAIDFNQKYAAGKANVYTDYVQMLEKEKLDVVYICLPPFAHKDEVQVAAENGTNIFIEKPIALSEELASKMVASVRAHKVKSQVGFMFRHGSAVERVKQMMDEGKIGAPSLFIGRYFCNSLHSNWWREKEKSGGQIVEQIIHVYDMARYLAGEPIKVMAEMDNLFHKDVERYTAEDVSSSIIKFKGGAIGSISATNTAIPNRWISDWYLVTKNATIYFESANTATITWTNETWPPEEKITSNKEIYNAETLDLISAIKEDREARVPIEEGYLSLKLVLAVRRAAEEGIAVKLEP